MYEHCRKYVRAIVLSLDDNQRCELTALLLLLQGLGPPSMVVQIRTCPHGHGHSSSRWGLACSGHVRRRRYPVCVGEVQL